MFLRQILSFAVLLLMSSFSVFAQSITYSLKYNAGSNRFEVYVTSTGLPGSINIGPSQATIIFEPSSSVTGQTSVTTTAVNGGPWNDQDFVVSPSGVYVGFQTTGSNVAITNGTPLLLFTFEVASAGGNCAAGVRLLVNASDNVDPTNVGADFTSYLGVIGVGDLLSTNNDNTFRSCAQLNTLPVRFLSFSAIRQASGVAINWVVGSEELVSSYELEVSTNGSIFSHLATKASMGKANYDYIDQGVARYNATKLYYRVKQLDRDGSFTYSPVKTVRLDVKGAISLYPNPARVGFMLNIPYVQANDHQVLLQLLNGVGQVLETRTISRAQAVNYYYNLQPSLPSGDYLLKIFEDGALSETKQVLIKK
jgi:hypothetical protein